MPQDRWRTISFEKLELSASQTKIVVAGKDQAERFPVRAHPLGGKTGGVAGTDIPLPGEERGRPGSPRSRGVEDRQTSGGPGVHFSGLVVRSRSGDWLDQEVTLQRRGVGN